MNQKASNALSEVQNLIKYNNYLTKKNIGKRISFPKKPKVAVSAIFQSRNINLVTKLARNVKININILKSPSYFCNVLISPGVNGEIQTLLPGSSS